MSDFVTEKSMEFAKFIDDIENDRIPIDEIPNHTIRHNCSEIFIDGEWLKITTEKE